MRLNEQLKDQFTADQLSVALFSAYGSNPGLDPMRRLVDESAPRLDPRGGRCDTDDVRLDGVIKQVYGMRRLRMRHKKSQVRYAT